MVDEAWERAVEAALHAGGEGSSSPARSLTLDGAVKCMHGRLPAAEILERHQSLEHLSMAGVGVTSLEGFPRLRNLIRLTLSDNRIAGGLDHLVAAGLSSLRDLDLSNNRIQDVDVLAPLAALRLVSLDLYECPVTRVKDYRSRVFGLIRTLKYLDKMDADENERPESDDDDDDGDGEEDDDEDDDEDEDPGSGEVANGGVSHSHGGVPAHPVEVNGVIDVDEEESDADEVLPSGGVEHHHGVNGFRVAAVGEAPDGEDEDVDEEDEEDEDDYEAEDDLGEEIDEDGDEEDPVVEVHDVPSSDDEEDEMDEDDEEDDEEEVEDDEEAEPHGSGRVAMMTGEEVGGEEIDGHEHGEGDDEDENGEIGEDDERLEDDRVDGEGHDDDVDADADDEVYIISNFLQLFN
jgi:hypothetical protein